MKNRRTVIASFLLIAVLVMGIGYAALTDNLFIKGEATLATTSAQTNFDEDVYFHEVAVVNSNGGNKDTTPDSVVKGSTDPDSATFYVKSLGNKDEYVIFSFVIKNDSTEFDAVISLDDGFPTTTDSNNFDITYYVEDDEGNHVTEDITCAAGGTVTVYVKVVLKNTPSANMTAAFNVNLTATSVNP